MLPREHKETVEEYRAGIIGQVSDWFGGYSISLVNGRFRAASLRTRQEAVEHQVETGRPYLHRRTTAVVRFIIPVPASKLTDGFRGTLGLSQSAGAISIEAKRVRELFFAIFVEAVI